MSAYHSILLELQYLPPVQYFVKLAQYERVYIEQHEHYEKGSYRNRCYIAGSNGLLRLTVPLEKGKNEGLNIRQVRVAYDEPWPRQHWESIRSAYGRAPFFDFYADALAPFFAREWTYLFDLNWQLLQTLIGLTGIETQLERTKTYLKHPPVDVLDFRNGIFPKKHRQKKDDEFVAPKYRQLFEERHGFLPNLSILDLLFCTGPQTPLLLEEAIRISQDGDRTGDEQDAKSGT